MKKFYITTAIPYVNAAPHIGHTLEFVEADAIARTHRLLGEETCLLSGGDENALKNVQASEKAGVPLQEFIDTNASLFSDVAKRLNVQFDVFQKGSNTKTHFPASQKLWTLCEKNGDIYKKEYEGLYCVGCEAFYMPEELNEQGECFEHPGKKLERIKESNYFFKLSAYQEKLIELISSDTLKIYPETRKNEVLSFLKHPLLDISISRTNERARNWGVPVPGDDTQRMYVWFDALNIYQSGIGFGWDEASYEKWWPADLHVIGKGITRFHAIYWPAFLLSAGLPLPKALFVHGYFTVNGQKMSKTLGNIIDPNTLIDSYGTDAIRYYFLREIPPFSDGDFSESRFIELYNADLANGIGNLAARVARLASQTENVVVPPLPQYRELYEKNPPYSLACTNLRSDEALAYIWSLIKEADKLIDDTEPWKLEGTKKTGVIEQLIPRLQTIATLLEPFLPTTATIIKNHFSQKNILAMTPIFPRIKTTK